MSDELIRFIFAWGPTLIFLLGFVIATLVGMIRGFRKSMILALQAIIVFSICLIAFLIIVNNENTDKWVVSIINNFKPGSSLQETMGVSPENESLKEILIEFIPRQMNFGDGFALILRDNGAYLATIVDMVYRIIFALAFYVIYLVLELIFYLVYLIFYPERRHKKKITKKYRRGEADREYRKHTLLGGLIGGLRGLVVGVVGISFLGTLFFIVGGGLGERSYDDYADVEFSDDNSGGFLDLNTVYEIYKNIGSYGETGIFKVLNAIKDPNDVPFYLYAADLVFQGGLKDETLGIEENIYLRRELGAFTAFSEDTFDLIMKYGSKEIVDFVNGNSDTEQMMDIIVEIMKNEEFQKEFNTLIDEFDSQTYFVNFSLSLLNSIVVHIDEDVSFLNSLDSNVKDIIRIMFNSTNGIRVNDILTKSDTSQLVKVCLSLLNVNPEVDETVDSTQATLRTVLNYGEILIPEFYKLSIFTDSDKSNRLNVVLRNLYDYFSQILAETGNGEDSSETITTTERAIRLSNTSIDSIDWVTELKSLLDVALSTLKLYDKIYKVDENGNLDIVNPLFGLFDDTNPTLEEDEKLFDSVVDALGKNKLLGVVLSMSYVENMVMDTVRKLVPGATLPSTISYSNEYDSEGKLIKYGEIYNFLRTIKLIAKTDGAEDLLNNMNTSDMSSIKTLADILNKEIEGTTILNQILTSDILYYTVSGLILNMNLSETTGLSIYVPEQCKEVDAENITLISRSSLSDFVSILPTIISIVDVETINVSTIIKDSRIPTILKTSKIAEGTISNMAYENIKTQEAVVVPERLANIENWLSTSESDGEVLKLIESINILDLNLEAINVNAIQITTTKMESILNSEILHYTISKNIENVIITSETDSIPKEAYDADVKTLISKTEILALTEAMEKLLDADETGISIGNIQYNNLSITKTKLQYVYNSYIAYSKVSSTLSNAVDGGIPTAAYVSSDKAYIKQEELNLLIDILATSTDEAVEPSIQIQESSAYNFENLNETKLNYVKESLITRYMLSTRLLENSGPISVPSKLHGNEFLDGDSYIEKEEFGKFLDAFAALYKDANGDISITTNISIEKMPSESQFEIVTNSGIVRANITRNLSIDLEDGTSSLGTIQLYAELSDKDELSDAVTPVLTQAELLRAMKAFKIISADSADDFNVSLNLVDIASMSSSQIYEITSSNIIRLALNELISRNTVYPYNLPINQSTVTIATANGVEDYSLQSSLIAGVYTIPANQCTLRTLAASDGLTLFKIEDNLDVNSGITVYTEVDASGTISTTSQKTLQAYFAVLRIYFNSVIA